MMTRRPPIKLSFLSLGLLALLALASLTTTFSTSLAGPASEFGRDSQTQAQRTTFLAAKQALQRNQWDEYTALRAELEGLNYALTPYLDYLALRKQLRKSDNSADTPQFNQRVRALLRDHPELDVSQRLNTSYLGHLARSEQWPLYLNSYSRVKKPSGYLQCQQARADIEVNGRVTDPQKVIRNLWLVPGSQSTACDPVFAHLFQFGQITDAHVWQRFEKAVNRGSVKLAEYLRREKLAESYHERADVWLKYRKHPHEAVMEAINSPQTYSRSMMVKAMRRVADNDAAQALDIWENLQNAYRFTDNEKSKIVASIGLHAALQKLDIAEEILTQVEGKGLTKSIREWRVRNAIQRYEWPRVSYWISQLTKKQQGEWRWRYWAARAQEEQGNIDAAMATYRILAQDRGYYSWLSADRAGLSYNIKHDPLTADEAIQKRLLKSQLMQLALELHAIEMPSFAKSVWNRSLKGLNKTELRQAALMAAEVEWYDQAIRALSKARYNFDQNLRYPIAWSDRLEARTDQLGIQPEWVYGLMRAESLFETTAKSHVGARGLMQLMPGTGRRVAEQLGEPLEHTDDLFDPYINMKLGTQYLADMLKRFNGNMVLASAAYNAGPNAVQRWIPAEGSIPADVWADTIPYKETRGYITKVMAYATMFDWRLNGGTENPDLQPQRITSRMHAITAGDRPGADAGEAF